MLRSDYHRRGEGRNAAMPGRKEKKEEPLWQVNKYRQQKFANGGGREGGKGRKGRRGGGPGGGAARRRESRSFEELRFQSFQGKKKKKKKKRAEQTEVLTPLPPPPASPLRIREQTCTIHSEGEREIEGGRAR